MGSIACIILRMTLLFVNHATWSVQVTFADATSMPARMTISHTPIAKPEPECFSMLAEMSMRTSEPQKLAHTLRVGRVRKVDKYIRLDFNGLLLPSRTAPASLGAVSYQLQQPARPIAQCTLQILLADLTG
jgi:hypothetical protein